MSESTMSTKLQLKKIQALSNCLKKCDVYKKNTKNNLLTLPTGDGMCLAFIQGVDLPIRLAIQLQQKLDEYNRGKIPAEIIRIRMGLNSGECFVFDDLQGNKNVWGPGIILAKRIMDLGEDDHILLSPSMAETLRELSDEYRKIIRPVHDYTIKHNITMLIYSAYGKNFGNQNPPTKNEYQKSKLGDEVIRLQNTVLYPEVAVNLKLKDPKRMFVHHKRTYKIMNTSDTPIKYVLHGIGTDVKVPSINDLNLKIYDNSNKEMKISSINLDKPYTKEFSTVFEKPVKKGEANRSYTIEYEIEEPKRFYENAFVVDCKKFSLSFEYNKSSSINQPRLYEINQENDKKIQVDTKPLVENNSGSMKNTWQLNDVVKGQTFRLEW